MEARVKSKSVSCECYRAIKNHLDNYLEVIQE
jgi:hypothetical protein